MPDYKNMSAVDAIRFAKDQSGMTAEELADKLGISAAVMHRYLRQNDGYSPSLEMIPRLCAAMGNTVLIDWLKAQAEAPVSAPQAKSRADVLTAVARASAELGDVSRILAETEKGGINAAKAKEIRAGLEEAKKACTKAQAQLQAVAAQAPDAPMVLYQMVPPRHTG